MGVFQEVRRVLKAGGLFLFSTEAASEEEEPGKDGENRQEGIVERESGRFAHSRSLITNLVASQGGAIELLSVETIPLRIEDDEPLPGDLFILKKCHDGDAVAASISAEGTVGKHSGFKAAEGTSKLTQVNMKRNAQPLATCHMPR